MPDGCPRLFAGYALISGRFSSLSVMSNEIENLATRVGAFLLREKMTLSTAESCTGGGIAAAITAIPGSSAYFKGGIVSYTNEVKQRLLGVQQATLDNNGVVSKQTVMEMARGAMNTLQTDAAIATSGVAGPTGGTEETPVGVIWIAVAYKNEMVTFKQEGDCGRGENVRRAIENGLKILLEQLENKKKCI